MIAPLPPQPGLPQPVDPSGAKPDPRGEGDAFAEILAAAAAAVPAPRVPGPPAIEHGPAVVRISDIEPGEPVEPVDAAAVQVPAQLPARAPDQAGLTDPASEIEAPRPDQPQPAARIFNQDGFFGASIDAAPVDPAAAPAVAIPPGAAAGPALPPRETPAPVEMPITELRPVAAGAMPAQSASVSSAAVLPRLSRVQPTPLSTLAAARPVALETEGDAGPVKPISRRFTLREPSARAAVQVAMRELEQGVHVAARAEGLDAAERVRLHDEIAALLARHGLSARSIRISAPLREWPSQERLK